MPPSSEVAKAPSRYFDIKHDGAIINAGGFWCEACLIGKPGSDTSPDPRYCQDCYGFLLKEGNYRRASAQHGFQELPDPGNAGRCYERVERCAI